MTDGVMPPRQFSKLAFGCHLTDAPELRALAMRLAPYSPADRYVLFEFSLDRAASTVYEGEGVVRQRWERDD